MYPALTPLLFQAGTMCDSVPLVLLPGLPGPGPHQSSPMFPGVGPVNPMLARMGLLLSFRERAGLSQASPESPSTEAPYDLSKPVKDQAEQPLDLSVKKKSDNDPKSTVEDENCNLLLGQLQDTPVTNFITHLVT